MTDKTILVIGTFDTKSDELRYLIGCIEGQGGTAMTMDVSVLGDPPAATDISKHRVAEAAGSSIQAAIRSGDENTAMQIMAAGAATLAADLHVAGRIDAMIAIGGTMGTDLALDCALVLPMGVPKYIVSTVAFSPLIPPERLPPDIQMILWAGGLYGLNSVCRSALSQAAGAVLGAARAVEPPRRDRPLVGMTSLGKSCLSYMVALKPALERRGFEVAVFHSIGMGGRAFEGLAAQGAFACVMDFCMQEFTNGVHGSVVNSGADRLSSAGRAGIPQIVAPGASDLVDMPTWTEIPAKWRERPYHAHNRLIASVAITPEERRRTAREIGARLARASGPVHVILPSGGIEEWDKPGEPAHDPEGLDAFLDEMRTVIAPPVAMSEIDAHINDRAFADTALAIFDAWVADGTVRAPDRKPV
ncbi:Tm-1-like ATP-binding domain-containing protein [Microbaculum marinisediminis]|uniref:Tm-1-like ATP-binding domain-containing protein n=1 Tax=Microbaculum marinisediminis TaxID=2931392 RepID=A0AAW5QZI7_9HYPH|nr:Tm-1-like ATP-binding domain-containing protein [Microbaculum sp. A6E488]MCT8972984.1 Tm-1-like ATP-binding domain-containing protein [Microbaculum sp. A6E488]